MYCRCERYETEVWKEGSHDHKLIIPPGHLRHLNELACNAKADYIIHTGDFGFYDDASLERIAEKYAIETF